MLRKILLGFAFLLGVTFEIMVYAMPLVAAIPFALICLGLFFWRKQRAEATMLLVSLLVLFGCLEVFVRFNADDIFYREHDKWALKGRYRANIHNAMWARFGDIVAMDPSLKDQIAEPHRLEFKTDSSGFRNSHDYAEEPYILLGDSFATSVGNTQSDTVVEQLNALSPNSFYSLAYPGAPRNYEANALTFLDQGHTQARFLWFIFEGNDFNPPGEETGAPYRPSKDFQWKDALSPRNIPFMTTRALMVFFKAVKMHKSNSDDIVIPTEIKLLSVAGHPMGFFKKYMDRIAAPKTELRILGTPEVMSRTACVFFIPDKYRVYKPWIENGPAISEPAAGLVALKDYFGARHIPVIDLTSTLKKAATKLLTQGEFVFWRDDTHWNGKGIKSILSDVQQCVAQDHARAKQN
jgi:hypothetical protein